MTVMDDIIKLVRELPMEKQVEVRSYALSLSSDKAIPIPSRNWMGLCEGDGIHVSEEDIAQIRREMWEHFPRDME